MFLFVRTANSYATGFLVYLYVEYLDRDPRGELVGEWSLVFMIFFVGVILSLSARCGRGRGCFVVVGKIGADKRPISMDCR